MTCPVRPVVAIVKTKAKVWGIQVTGICHSYQKMVAVFHCLKFYFQMSVFLIVRTVFRDALMMSNEPLFTVQEVVDLTINFYRRNYIEGLFLSSGVFNQLISLWSECYKVVKKLRLEENFNGYIHLKTIPGGLPRDYFRGGLICRPHEYLN